MKQQSNWKSGLILLGTSALLAGCPPEIEDEPAMVTISGTIIYDGYESGSIIVTAHTQAQWDSDEDPFTSTELSAPGDYSLAASVGLGAVVIAAFNDVSNSGIPPEAGEASDSTTITVGTSNLTGVDVTLTIVCPQINAASGSTVCLDGVWATDCQPADANTRQDTFTFSGNSFVWEEVRDCEGTPITEVNEITFSVEGDQPDVGWEGGTAPTGLPAIVTATRGTFGPDEVFSIKGIFFVDDIASPVELYFGGFDGEGPGAPNIDADGYTTVLDLEGTPKQ